MAEKKAEDIIREEMPYAIAEGPLNRERVLKKAQKADPVGMGLMQAANTADKTDWLNTSQFYTDDYVSKSPIPIQKLDTFLLENAAYGINVPFGTEDKSIIEAKNRSSGSTDYVLGAKTGAVKDKNMMINLPGEDKDPSILIHEAAHGENPEDQPRGIYESISKALNDTLLSLNSPVGESGKPLEEVAVTSLDLYRAFHRKDETKILSSIEYLTRQYLRKGSFGAENVPDFTTKEGVLDLAKNASDYAVSIAAQNNLYSDEEILELKEDIKKSFNENSEIIEKLAKSTQTMYETGNTFQLEKDREELTNKYLFNDAEMSEGGLMAADGVLIDEIISGLPEEDPFESKQDPSYERPPVRPVPEDFDPESILGEIFPEDIEKYEEQFPEQEASPDSQYSSEEINTMDKELDQAFSDFENSRGSAADRDAYRNRVREIYTSNPELFMSEFQDKNTDQLIEMYNELDFSDEEVPFDDEIAETAKYRATVPFGSEDDTNLGGGDIFNLSIGRKGTVAGKSRRYDDGVSEVFIPGGADKDLRDNILRHEGLHSLTEHESVRELLTVYPNELLVRAYDVLRGIASGDREWAEQALKFIEKAYRGKYGKSDIKLILSKLMPLLKEKAAEMSEGGLMADPLMLSETAEEEAEPKMGVGDYIEGAKELITDFSPAGTAQSMIDAAEEAYKLATGAEDASLLDFGIAAIGALPGGKTATKAVETASKVADDVVEASQSIAKLDNYVPKKTVTAYKLVREKNGKFYPLFVGQGKEKSDFPVGEWIKAEAGELSPKGKVKSSIGELAYRPGFHAGDLPIATHIGGKSSKAATKPDYRPDDQVWVEIEMANDVDWGSEALKRAQKTKDGRIKSVTAHITDRVPTGGHYRYKTNPNMTGEWLIGGEMKVTRVLDDAEVRKINEAAGVSDLPRKSELPKTEMNAGGLMSDEYNRAES